jgi:hypothetical protein
MLAFRLASGFAAALLGVMVGRVLGEHIGLGAVHWPVSVAAAIGVTAVSTVRHYRRRKRNAR